MHVGHLRLALELVERLGLERVLLIPCREPPHRAPPVAPAAERFALVQLAVADEPRLSADDRELTRPGPSYTVDTLVELRAEQPAAALCLLLGADTFIGLPGWHRWRELLELAHLVVVPRPGVDVQPHGELAAALAGRWVERPGALAATAAGRVIVQDVPALDVSATRIRTLLRRGGNVRHLIPEPCLRHIRARGLYLEEVRGDG